MKKKKVFLAVILCLCLLFTACSGQNGNSRTGDTVEAVKQETSTEAKPVPKEKNTELVMVYMVGSNLESESALASKDIAEMAKSNFDTSRVQVLVCTGGASRWWIDGIQSDVCSVFEVVNHDITEKKTLTGTNMSEPETLTEFLDYGYENYKADCYSLVLWNHGGGAVVGYGADENYDYAMMSTGNMDKALSKSKVCASEKFEWVGYDACLMGMIEIADMLSNYANYMVASEEVEAGYGWDYAFLGDLNSSAALNGDVTGKAILKHYADFYTKNYRYTPDYTLSCIDLSKVGAVVGKLDEFVNVAAKSITEGGYSEIARRRCQVKSFGRLSDSSFYDTIDLYDLANKMKNPYPSESAALQTAVKDCVVSNVTNVTGAHGMAIYFPYDNKEYAKQWLMEYSSEGFSSSYVKFIQSFAATLSGEPITEWQIAEIAPEESTQTSGEYAVQLTAEQIANYSDAKYSIWEQDSDNVYICWLFSKDVNLSQDGKISSAFDGTQFYLEDSGGNSRLCCAVEIDRGEGYVKYAVPVMVGDLGNVRTKYIHIRVENGTSKITIAGIYNTLNTDEGLFPDKNVEEIADGERVHPYYFAREIVFNEDGTVAPFDDWKMASGIGTGFYVSGDLTVTAHNPEDNQTYCCLINIKDTQGNSYYTKPVYMDK